MWHNTPGNLVRGSNWLCTQNLYANFQPWLTRHPNVNKWVSSPDLPIFSKFHRHILKNWRMLFPKTFISALEKIDVGLKKQAANFSFSFTGRRIVWYSCFDFFFKCKMKVFSGYGPSFSCHLLVHWYVKVPLTIIADVICIFFSHFFFFFSEKIRPQISSKSSSCR